MNEDFKAVFELSGINLNLKVILRKKNLSKFLSSGKMPHNLGNSPSIVTYELSSLGKRGILAFRSTTIYLSLKDNAEIMPTHGSN